MKIPTERQWQVLYHHREMHLKLEVMDNTSLQESYIMNKYDETDYELFQKQREALRTYVQILEERIARY